MFSTKEIDGKEYVMFESYIYDDEIMDWVLIEEFETRSIVNQENITLGQSTII